MSERGVRVPSCCTWREPEERTGKNYKMEKKEKKFVLDLDLNP